MKKPPFHKIVFVVFKRIHEYAIFETEKKISLEYSDNIHFEKNLTNNYIQELMTKYVRTSSLSYKIFELFSDSPGKELSILDIAEKLEVFTPKILKQMEKMKPLFQVKKTPNNLEKYCLYHPLFNTSF